MKKTAAIISVFLGLCFLVACSEDPPKVPKTVSKPLTTEPVKPVPLPEPEPVAPNEWPFIRSSGDAEGSLANNYLTKNYVLIFDGSGSMAESGCSAGRYKIDVAKEAVMEWANTLPKDVNLGLVAFFYNRWAVMDLSPVNINEFSSHITAVKAGGKTPLTQAMKQSYDMLTKEGVKQLGYGEYTIVVVTDGIANNRTALSAYVKTILRESPVNIYTIGFCIGQDHSLNQPGETVYKAAENPEALKKGLSEVLAESDTFDEGDFD